MWASESWTLTKRQKQRLRAVQRNMLRRFAAPRRAPGEDWVSWIRMATRQAEAVACEAGMSVWANDHLRAKWRWAGHVARMSVDRTHWLPYRATIWKNAAWRSFQTSNLPGYAARIVRSRPGRWRRWEDEIHNFCSTALVSWKDLALDRDDWSQREMGFLEAHAI